MKKILSFLLTIVMLSSMIIMPASAEGNAALFYDGAGITAGSTYFQRSYCYTANDGSQTFLQRDNVTGDFDVAFVFDFKFTDINVGDGHMTGFDMTPHMHANMNYHFGYNFNNKAFMVYRAYMPGGNTNSEYKEFARMSYDMPLNEWHEFALTATEGKMFRMYLDGVLMLEFDFDTINGPDEFDWTWNVEERNDKISEDRWWLTLLDSDIYIDNFGVYSGDYDFGTGTASTEYFYETEFANLANNSGNFGPFTCSQSEGCPFWYSANGGTDKVTYDRDFAVNHTHDWSHDTENSSVAHCLVPGYDLYTCTCGASEQRNYVEPLGHLPGFLKATPIQADDNNTGVQQRTCNRQGCLQNYYTLVAPTSTAPQALHMYTKGGDGMYNGYMAVNNSDLMVQDDGVAVVADIMPVSQVMKSYTAIGATMGGCSDRYFIGYDYSLAKFVIKNGTEILAESDKTLNNYEWAEWMWHRDGYTVSLYIDGELVVTAELDEYTYDLNGPADDKNDSISDTHFFLFKSPACELLLDNVIVASPDYDAEHRTGIIYDYVAFSGDDHHVNAEATFLYGRNEAISFICFDKSYGEGYKLENHGRPGKDVIEIHRDMALKIDSTYEDGSIWSYSQLGDSNVIINSANSAAGLDFEYSFDFYAYDWCTDVELLSKKTGTDADGNPIMQTGSAFIGSHINSNGVEGGGNGFVGYDFLRQQAVIGSVSEQAGGVYGEDNVFVDYAIEKDTWHNYTLKYDYVPVIDEETGDDNGYYEFSILIDGNTVASKTFEYMDVSYFIYFPNFVKGYQDNLVVKVDGNVLEGPVDFTNGYSVVTNTMTFESGLDWSLVPGGVPTHVYEKQIFPASCVTDGYTIYTCSCGESTYTSYDQIASGHDWNDGEVTVEPTETTEGVLTISCKVCGETKTESIPVLEPSFIYGDVNSDGKVVASDLTLLRRYIGGAAVEINSNAADVNADGTVKASDITVLGRKLSGADITLGPTE